jgi:hypothetical protein
VLREFQEDGVLYVELRTTPRAIPNSGVTKDDYVRTILDILRAHNEDDANTMRAFLLLSIDRRNTVVEAEDVVDVAIKYQSAGVVGVDLCGDPAKGDIRIFAGSFARAKAAGLKITLHFAESEASSSDLELETLLAWKPDRLGHVIHVKERFRKVIEQQNIGVELCLSCNVHAKMIRGTYSDHHFSMWRHSSVPVALSVRPSNTLTEWRLMRHRPTMLVFSAAHCRMSISLLHSISVSTEKISGHSASELLTQSSRVRMNVRVLKRCTRRGTDGTRESTNVFTRTAVFSLRIVMKHATLIVYPQYTFSVVVGTHPPRRSYEAEALNSHTELCFHSRHVRRDANSLTRHEN